MPASKPNPVFSVLSYLGLLALIPFFLKKDDPHLRWHAAQGLILLVVAVLAFVALGLVGAVLPAAVVGLAGKVLAAAFTVLAVFGIFQALTGRRWSVPVIAPITQRVAGA